MPFEAEADNQLIIEGNPQTVNGRRIPGYMPQHWKIYTQRLQSTEGSEGALHVRELGINSLANVEISVSTTRVEITTGLANRRTLEVFANGNEEIFIGDASVTVENGFPLLPGEKRTFTFKPGAGAQLYAIAESAQSLRVLETN